MARVLVITRNMPPLWGGMEQLNWHMVDQLAQRAAVRVIGPRGSADKAPEKVVVSEVSLKPLLRFLLSALIEAMHLARGWRPDLIIAGSGLTAPIAWLAAKMCRAKSAVYVHGLDVTVDHPLYRWIWMPALRRMDRVIANSHATHKLAERAGVAPGRIKVVYPGVNLPDATMGAMAAERFRAELCVRARPLLLSVGRLTERKGLREFVTDVLPKIVASQPNVLLLVVGDAPALSLHAKAQTQESIMKAASAAGVAENLKFLGIITDRKRLSSVYQVADIHVFPVRHIPDDPEGFGMVAIEAAAHGLPTVSYATGGVVDAVAEGISGYLLPPGDADGFAAAVLRLLDRPLARTDVSEFAKKFAWEHFGHEIARSLPILERSDRP